MIIFQTSSPVCHTRWLLKDSINWLIYVAMYGRILNIDAGECISLPVHFKLCLYYKLCFGFRISFKVKWEHFSLYNEKVKQKKLGLTWQSNSHLFAKQAICNCQNKWTKKLNWTLRKSPISIGVVEFAGKKCSEHLWLFLLFRTKESKQNKPMETQTTFWGKGV